MKKVTKGPNPSPGEQITAYIDSYPDWRGSMLGRIREIVLQAAPGITEEWKWGTPVWTKDGLVCAASGFKEHVKINFFKGASLEDPKGLFNAGLEGKTMRSIDFREGDKINAAGLKSLVKAAVALNAAKG